MVRVYIYIDRYQIHVELISNNCSYTEAFSEYTKHKFQLSLRDSEYVSSSTVALGFIFMTTINSDLHKHKTAN